MRNYPGFSLGMQKDLKPFWPPRNLLGVGCKGPGRWSKERTGYAWTRKCKLIRGLGEGKKCYKLQKSYVILGWSSYEFMTHGKFNSYRGANTYLRSYASLKFGKSGLNLLLSMWLVLSNSQSQFSSQLIHCFPKINILSFLKLLTTSQLFIFFHRNLRSCFITRIMVGFVCLCLFFLHIPSSVWISIFDHINQA